MYSLTCHCILKHDKIKDAIDHTLGWIPKVQNQYKEPKYYEAFQDTKNPEILTYFMTFSSQEKERMIATKQEPRKFGEDLYKMCKNQPTWVEHILINSIRNSKADSQIHTRVEYQVRQESIPDVLNHISNFIDTVRDTEPELRVYESYQNKDDPSKFTHLAEFKDSQAEQNHKVISHTKKFAEFLYPVCQKEPKFIYMKLIGSARR